MIRESKILSILIAMCMCGNSLPANTLEKVAAPICASEIVEIDTVVPETISLGECMVTAYCKENYPHICNDGDSSTTATGTTPTPGKTIAVDPSVIPYGSEVIINKHTYIAEDCGGAIKGKRIDICFDTHKEALDFGIQYLDVSYVIKEDNYMCDICRQTPCSPRCPNADYQALYTCEDCGCDIYDGDTMYVINDTYYCEDCIQDCKRYAELDY